MMPCATVTPEQPVVNGMGSSKAIRAQTPSLTVPPVDEGSLRDSLAGSLARSLRSAVAMALTSVTDVPLPRAPRAAPGGGGTPAMAMTTINSLAADVLG